MIIPNDLSYTAQHEWVKITDGVARIGITDYAQDALGDVVFVGVPSLGASVAAEQSFTEVESTKSVSDLRPGERNGHRRQRRAHDPT